MKARALLIGAAAAALAACAQTPKETPLAGAPAAPAAAATPADRARQAIDLLNQGRVAEARPVLEAVLAEEPDNKVARRLAQQLDADPKSLISGKPQPYTVGPGETLSMLAGRFLGDPLLFYALARYNGFAAPAHVQPGHVIQIPRNVRPATASAKPKPAAPAAKAETEAPAAPARDPARAARLRASGLDQLNRGAPARAVSLLQQALAADPGNPAIQRDLARAQRIQASLSR